jgi:hypothetical protein
MKGFEQVRTNHTDDSLGLKAVFRTSENVGAGSDSNGQRQVSYLSAVYFQKTAPIVGVYRIENQASPLPISPNK